MNIRKNFSVESLRTRNLKMTTGMPINYVVQKNKMRSAGASLLIRSKLPIDEVSSISFIIN